jgi:hypothetical protein
MRPLVANLFCSFGYCTIDFESGQDERVEIITYHDELKLESPIIEVRVNSGERKSGERNSPLPLGINLGIRTHSLSLGDVVIRRHRCESLLAPCGPTVGPTRHIATS